LSIKLVWLLKNKNEKRSKEIYIILHKALQQLICLVFEPLVEFTSVFNSFGFRKYRSPKTAIVVLQKLFKTLNKNYIKNSFFRQTKQKVPIIFYENNWIYNADIKKEVDQNNHRYLFKNLFLPPLGIHLTQIMFTSGVINKQIFTIFEKKVL
jgi:retron-type reverse transcriptase